MTLWRRQHQIENRLIDAVMCAGEPHDMDSVMGSL
jgi:hypothetical protein